MHKQYLWLFLPLLLSCASAPQTPPEWAVRGVAAVYPANAYIAQEGRGADRDGAQTNALAALSRYFVTEVSTAANAAESWTQGGGHNARLDTATFVQSATKLFAVRYAAPWYNPQEKEYVSVAYIDREEAWAVFRPQAQKEADTFRALYRAAESELDPLKMLFDYQTARRYTRRDEFINCMSFGETLHPENMRALVKDIRENAAALDAKINESRVMAGIYIDCSRDFESVLSSTLTRLLSAEGLIITGSRESAPAVCAVTVDEGFQAREGTGNFYYPAITITLRGATGGVLFSYSASPGKQAAVAADVAKRRAYTALAATLESNFIEELHRQLKKTE